MTPMLRQYKERKEHHQDCILLFRLGDFYEMFFDDALTASRELEITLTKKSIGDGETAPMCGVPCHSVESYLARLVEKGHKAAICEQVEEPSMARGIVKREVVRIITPGAIINQSMLDEHDNNYLASIFLREEGAGLALCDISTGELSGCELRGEGAGGALINEIVRVKAREALVDPRAENSGLSQEIAALASVHISPLPPERYVREDAERAISGQFGVNSLDGLGLSDKPGLVSALGALIYYLNETQKHSLAHISGINVYELGSRMALDASTMRNLELTESLHDRRINCSLLGVFVKPCTAMGGRRLRQWLRAPLNRAAEINPRLDAVSFI